MAQEGKSALGKGPVVIAADGSLRQVLQGIVGVFPVYPKAEYWAILVAGYGHLHIRQKQNKDKDLILVFGRFFPL